MAVKNDSIALRGTPSSLSRRANSHARISVIRKWLHVRFVCVIDVRQNYPLGFRMFNS
jgi:hypothetical protein